MLLSLIFAFYLANPVVHDIDGQKFICFDKQWAQELLQLRVDFPKLQEQIKGLEALVNNKDLQIQKYDELVTNYETQITGLSEEVRLLNTKIQDDNAWWRSRWFVFGLGVVGGIASSIGLVYLIKASTGL